jgi:hypothetical protein
LAGLPARRVCEAVDALGRVAMGPASDRLAALARDRGNFGDGEALLGQQQDHLRTQANPDIARRSVEFVKLAQLIDVQAVQTQCAHRRLPA